MRSVVLVRNSVCRTHSEPIVGSAEAGLKRVRGDDWPCPRRGLLALNNLRLPRTQEFVTSGRNLTRFLTGNAVNDSRSDPASIRCLRDTSSALAIHSWRTQPGRAALCVFALLSLMV